MSYCYCQHTHILIKSQQTSAMYIRNKTTNTNKKTNKSYQNTSRETATQPSIPPQARRHVPTTNTKEGISCKDNSNEDSSEDSSSSSSLGLGLGLARLYTCTSSYRARSPLPCGSTHAMYEQLRGRREGVVDDVVQEGDVDTARCHVGNH